MSSRLRGIRARAQIARGVLMVKITNTCILSNLWNNLFLDRQHNILFAPQYLHSPVYGRLHEIEIKKYGYPKN